MPKYKVYLWEWDMLNGEYTYRDYYGETVEAEDEDALWEILNKRLDEMSREAEGEGWDCENEPDGSLICTKRCEDEVEEVEDDEEICVIERQIGYDVEEIT